MIEVEVVASRAVAGVAPPASSVARSESLVYIPSMSSPDASPGGASVEDRLLLQTEAVYQRAGEALRAAGLGWRDVVKTLEFVRDDALPGYRRTADVRRRYFGEHFPAATGIVMRRLTHPDALIQIEFMASALPWEPVDPGWSRRRGLTYVPAVRAGNFVLLSGQLPLDSDSGAVLYPGDVTAQSRAIYDTIARVLEAAGARPDAVVKTVEYVTLDGLRDYRHTAGVRKQIFSAPYPASTGVVCDRLLRPGATLEVDAIAVMP